MKDHCQDMNATLQARPVRDWLREHLERQYPGAWDYPPFDLAWAERHADARISPVFERKLRFAAEHEGYRYIELAGVYCSQLLPGQDGLLRVPSYWADRISELRRDALMIGAFRYERTGILNEGYLESATKRIRMFRASGNAYNLIDAINLLGICFGFSRTFTREWCIVNSYACMLAIVNGTHHKFHFRHTNRGDADDAGGVR